MAADSLAAGSDPAGPLAAEASAPEPLAAEASAAEPPAAESAAGQPAAEPATPHSSDPTAAYPTVAANPWARPGGPEQPAEWVDPTPTDPILRIPPTPPTPPEPKSTAAAVLLNLTGVGAGYFYLRRRWQAWTATVLTVALVVVAFITNAAANPWLWRILAAVWLVILVLDARRIAVKHPPIANRRPVVIGAIAVVAVVGAYIGYGVLGRGTYDDGLAAQGRGDCAVATDQFKAVTGPYELTLSSDISAANRGLVECADFTHAADSDDEATVVQRYGQFRVDHPDSPLRPFVRDKLVETYTTWARGLRDEGKLADSIKVYRDLLSEDESFAPEVADAYMRLAKKLTSETPVSASAAATALEAIADEFGDTPTAKEVPAAFDALYAAAIAPIAAGQPCKAVDVLAFFAGLTNKVAAKVAGEAKNQYPRAMLDCGLNELRDGQAAIAVGTLDRSSRPSRITATCRRPSRRRSPPRWPSAPARGCRCQHPSARAARSRSPSTTSSTARSTSSWRAPPRTSSPCLRVRPARRFTRPVPAPPPATRPSGSLCSRSVWVRAPTTCSPTSSAAETWSSSSTPVAAGSTCTACIRSATADPGRAAGPGNRSGGAPSRDHRTTPSIWKVCTWPSANGTRRVLPLRAAPSRWV